jgi:23S rRNA (cytosine1962-C5)-methyltransferase
LQIPVETATWSEFELLDSGKGQKLERWGKKIFVRPEPKALWRKASPELWDKADAVCDENERWRTSPGNFELTWEGIKFGLHASQESKHLGLFPEQEPHWRYLKNNLKPDDRVLNLFAYTGAATLIPASIGCKVTHVDASRPSVDWARENAKRNNMEAAPIRWIVEDAMTYLRREEKRGSRYEAILLDPPSFGRGPKGELWKIENIADLIDACAKVLSEKPRLVLLTMYNLEASALSLANLLQTDKLKGVAGNFEIQIGELALQEQPTPNRLPTPTLQKGDISALSRIDRGSAATKETPQGTREGNNRQGSAPYPAVAQGRQFAEGEGSQGAAPNLIPPPIGRGPGGGFLPRHLPLSLYGRASWH